MWRRPSRGKRVVWATRTTERVAAHLTELGSLLGRPRPEFRARLRDELLRTQIAERVPAARPPAERPEFRPRSLLVRLRPVCVFGGLLAFMFATGSHAYRSVPGDLLYPLKRAAESTLLTFTTDDDDRAQREMVAARLRATEAAALLGFSTPDRRLVEQTLDDMDSKTRAALSRVKPRDKTNGRVRRFAREQRSVVEPLLPKLDGENRDKANQYLSYIDTFTSGSH